MPADHPGKDAKSGADARGDLKVALLEVTHQAQAQFASASGVGATLMMARSPLFMTSNVFTEAIDIVQYGLGEGPCLAAVETCDVVWSGSIGDGEPRWPRFTTHTAKLGLGSVLSAPILCGSDAIGSLNLYARAHRTFDDDDAVSIRDVAASVSSDLRSLHLLAAVEVAAVEVAIALHDRKDVDVAVGVLADRYVLTPRQARVLLAQLAQHDGVDDVAAAHSLIQGDAPR